MKPPTENGIYPRLPRETYDRIERANFSRLKHFRRSPFHFRAAGTVADKDSGPMRIGRASHVATLEPERFRAVYTVWDGGTRRGKEWEKFKAQAAADGLEVLTEDEYEKTMAIAKAALSDEHSAKYLRNGSSEVTLLWTHQEEESNGLPGYSIDCKARIDFSQGLWLVDLKSTRDASPDAFGRSAYNLDYATQAAWYQDGYAALNKGVLMPYAIVAVESEAPHAVQVYRMPERLLDVGRATYRGYLAQLAQCRRTNHWPGYADGELDLELPRWAQAQNDVVDDGDEDTTGMGLVINQ